MSILGIKLESYVKPLDMEYTVRLSSARDKEKFIKRVEQLVRSSMEYRDYIAYLKDYVDMSHCAFFKNMENTQGNRVRIEIHHEPFTLFDIVKVVLNKYLAEGIDINEFYIADEVMKLHYENKVGLVPLSKSIHEIVHTTGQIKIPLNLVYGNYKEFLDEYGDYLHNEDDGPGNDLWDKLQQKITETQNIKLDELEKTLSPTYVYIDVDGFSLPTKIEDKEELSPLISEAV